MSTGVTHFSVYSKFRVLYEVPRHYLSIRYHAHIRHSLAVVTAVKYERDPKDVKEKQRKINEWGLHSGARRRWPQYQDLYSLSGRTSYHNISWSLKAARFMFRLFQTLWNLTGTSTATLSRCLSNFRAMRLLWHPISLHGDFTRSYGKSSVRLVNRGLALR